MTNLKTLLKELNITQQEVAEELNIKSLSTVNLKINGKASFTTVEANLLKNLINEKSKVKFTLEELFASNDS